MNLFKNNKAIRLALSINCFAVVAAAAFYLAARGAYGWTLFVMLPVIAGGLGCWTFLPRTWGKAIRVGATTGVLACGLFLLLGREGYVCVLMALPVGVPLTTVGSLIAFKGRASSIPNEPAAMAMLVPLTLFFDTNAKPLVYSISTSIIVNAPPERVWKNVVAFPDIANKPDWLLSTGVAYPIRTRIEGTGVGTPRDCDLSTGTVQERVVVWDAPRLLRFVVTATPPSMKEMGVYGPIYPKHLNGYYISKEGQFELSALSGGRTLVVGTSWYEHGLWPAEYWRLWTDAVVHHIHRRVLHHIQMLSESEP